MRCLLACLVCLLVPAGMLHRWRKGTIPADPKCQRMCGSVFFWCMLARPKVRKNQCSQSHQDRSKIESDGTQFFFLRPQAALPRLHPRRVGRSAITGSLYTKIIPIIFWCIWSHPEVCRGHNIIIIIIIINTITPGGRIYQFLESYLFRAVPIRTSLAITSL